MRVRFSQPLKSFKDSGCSLVYVAERFSALPDNYRPLQGVVEMFTNKTKRQLLAAGASLAPLSAFAVAPTTIAELTTAISFADVALGILAVAALLTAVYVTWKGAKMVISAVKGL